MFHRYGGGLRKGTAWNLDTVYLEKQNQKIDITKVFQGDWNLSMTKNLDTAYLVNARLQNFTKSQKTLDTTLFTNSLPIII